MGNLKRYIPELVYNEIKQLNYKNKDHLYVVCDMIFRSTIYKKMDDIDGYIDIPSYYFKDIIDNYKDYLSFLFENSIVETDSVYSKEAGKSLGYKFNDKYISKLVPIVLENNVLKRRIIKNINENKNAVNNKLKVYKNNFLNNFKINYDKAVKHLDIWFEEQVEKIQTELNLSSSPLSSSYVGEIILNPNNHKGFSDQKIENYLNKYKKIVNKYNSIFISLSSINDGNLFFRKNKTNGRIDTNLTNLKSEYKKFIISKKPLKQIDIKNSQPFILSLYLNNTLTDLTPIQRKELDIYNDWTSNGVFYENVIKTYYNQSNKVLSRKQIKDIMFCVYYSKNGSYSKDKKIFKSIFPFLMEVIEKEKNKNHNQFAIKLQKIESEICIDKICSKLDLEKINYFTIHDAWLVDDDKVEITEKIIVETFIENFKQKPSLNVEDIN